MPPPAPLDDRVTELEILLTHLQADLAQLSQVVIDQQKGIDSLGKAIKQIEQTLSQGEDGPEKRDPEQERPPHY